MLIEKKISKKKNVSILLLSRPKEKEFNLLGH